MILFWLVYFYSCYFYYRLFKLKKCQKLNLNNYNYISSRYTGNLSLGNLLVFLKNFILYQPKFLAYNYFYNSIKVYNDKNVNENVYLFLPIILSFLLLALPFRLFIKWLTGFSYFSIKISAICSTQMIDVLAFDWEWKNFYDDIIESYLQSITSYFFTGLFLDVSEKKIYYNFDGVGIYFNPPHTKPKDVDNVLKCVKLVKQTDYIKEALRIGVKDIKPSLIVHNTIKGPNINSSQVNTGFYGARVLNKDGSIFIYCESNQQHPIYFSNDTEYPVLYQSPKGIITSNPVNCHAIITASHKDGVAFSKMVHYNEKDIKYLEEDKLSIQKAIWISMLSPSWMATKGGLKPDKHVNFYDKVQEMHDKKELNDTMSHQYEYASNFFEENGLKLVNVGLKTPNEFFEEFNKETGLVQSIDEHKKILIIDMIQNTTIKDGVITLPDSFENSSYTVKKSANFIIDNID